MTSALSPSNSITVPGRARLPGFTRASQSRSPIFSVSRISIFSPLRRHADPPAEEAGRDHPRVVEDDEIARTEQTRQVVHPLMPLLPFAVQHQQAALPTRRGLLRDALGREVVVELAGQHVSRPVRRRSRLQPRTKAASISPPAAQNGERMPTAWNIHGSGERSEGAGEGAIGAVDAARPPLLAGVGQQAQQSEARRVVQPGAEGEQGETGQQQPRIAEHRQQGQARRHQENTVEDQPPLAEAFDQRADQTSLHQHQEDADEDEQVGQLARPKPKRAWQ